MKPRNILQTLLLISLCAVTVKAQERSFLFTMSQPGKGEMSFIHYDAAFARQTFEPFGFDGLEQNLGVQENFGQTFTLSAYMGMALDGGASGSTEQAEFLGRILGSSGFGMDLSAGLGLRHEYSGSNVLLGRIIVGRDFTEWQTYANLVFEHAFAAGRDPVDLTTTLGFSRCLTDGVRLGVEAVGQDLEGFWESEESEGGAVVFVGPSASFVLSGSPWNLVVGGGAIIRASYSQESSSALRSFPEPQHNGFIVRSVLSYGL